MSKSATGRSGGWGWAMACFMPNQLAKGGNPLCNHFFWGGGVRLSCKLHVLGQLDLACLLDVNC